MRRTLLVAWLLLAILLLTAPGVAQSIYATLSGTVTDNTGALVPGADITVTDAKSGAVRKTVSNSAGYFSVPMLPSGTYNVAVLAKGFGKWEAKNIPLNSNDSRTMNVDLKVEAVTEAVEVTGQVTELATIDSGDRSHTISAIDLQSQSLVGRSAIEFLKILPGSTLQANSAQNRPASDGQVVGINNFAPGSNAGGLSSFKINGQSVDITMDGQHSFDPGASGNATPVNPNPDMISELTVLSSNFGAENARGPVVVNTVTKAGGNAFHGQAYMYARNSAMNAEDKFNKETEAASNGSLAPGSLKVPSSYYYPGFNIGGPVLIPGTNFNKSRQKVFFFDGFEWYRQELDAGLNRSFVPTDAMLNGDFRELTQWVTANQPGYTNGPVAKHIGTLPVMPGNPNTACFGGPCLGLLTRINNGCTISGGVLSSGCISSQAQLLLRAYLPAPNADPTNTGFNYVQAMSVPQHSWQNVARGDWNVSENTKVYVTYSRQREGANMPMGLWIQSGDWVVPAPSNVIGKNGSDNLGVSFLHVFSPTLTAETRFGYTKVNFPSEPSDPKKLIRSELGYTSTGIYGQTNAPAIVSWGASFPNLGDVGHDYHPSMIAMKGIPSVSENLTKVFGSHTTKYGFYYEHTYNKQDNWGQYMGVFPYGATGWNGGLMTGNEYADALMGIGSNGYFEQALPPPSELAQNIAAFYGQDSWKLSRRITVNYGMRFEHIAKPYSNPYGLAIFDPTKYDTQFDTNPNANTQSGVTWHSLNSNIPLSGADSRFLFFSPRVGAAIDVFGNAKTVLRGGWGKYRAYDSIQSNSYTGPTQTAYGSSSWTCGWNDPACPTWESVDLHKVTTPPVYGQTMSAGLKGVSVMDPHNDEQPLVTSYSFTIDQKLPAKFNLEISYVGNSQKFMQSNPNLNAVPFGAITPAAMTNPLTAADCTTNGGDNLGSTGCKQHFRQYKAYTNITDSVTAGKTQFDSLQMSLTRTLGNLTLQANYTFAKSMGDAVQLNNGGFPASIPLEQAEHWLWGVMPDNRAHVLSLAYVIRMPKFNGNGFAKALADGWEISGITQVQSGAQLTSQKLTNLNFGLTQTGDNVHLLGTDDIQLYPVFTCKPTTNLNKDQFVNPSCFAPNPAGQLGDAGMPYMPGPKFFNSDITLMKTFKLTERQGLQFRLMAFNFLNHGLLSFAPNDNNLLLNFNAAGQAPTNFGLATHHYGRRIIELGLKYNF